MTAHSSKGLEFNYVFLIKCSKRIWGQKRSMQKIALPYGIIKKDLKLTAEEKEDDERRLFYVALTRAKKEIFISYGKKRQENGREKEDLPSIFVEEINKDLMEKFDTTDYDAEAMDYQIFAELRQPKEEMLLNEKAYLHGILQNLTMTATGLNNYLTCPRKFFFQNVIKFPLPQKPSTMLGIAVHTAIDKYFKKYRKTLMKPAAEELVIEFKKCLNNFILTDEDYQQLLARGRHILTEYYFYYQATFTPDSMTELNFSSHNIHLDNIPLTGKIDKIDFIDKDAQTVKIIDFKTGNPDNKAKKMEESGDYWQQLIFYKILCDLSPIFKFKAQKAEVDFLERGKKSAQYIRHEIPLNEGAVEQVKNTIRVAWAGIQRLEFEKLETESEPCRFCDFKKVCWKKG
jgi:DNA helicase-2/ATP-dependent DNA helicase PcrA